MRLSSLTTTRVRRDRGVRTLPKPNKVKPKLGLQEREAIPKCNNNQTQSLAPLFTSASLLELEGSLTVVVNELKRTTLYAKTCDYTVYLCPRRFRNAEMAKGVPLADPHIQHSEIGKSRLEGCWDADALSLHRVFLSLAI